MTEYIILAIGLVLLALWQKERAYHILVKLMLTAKSLAKDAILNSGKEQEDWVVDNAYIYLPKWITMFISKEVMRKLISYIYRKAKDYLDDGNINGSK